MGGWARAHMHAHTHAHMHTAKAYETQCNSIQPYSASQNVT